MNRDEDTEIGEGRQEEFKITLVLQEQEDGMEEG